MNCKKFAKDLYFLPKWRNFAESGHTGSKPVFRKAKENQFAKNKIPEEFIQLVSFKVF